MFDVNAGASNVDAGFEGRIAAVRLSAKFSGTLTLARSLAVTKAFSQQGGTFSSGEQVLTLKAFTLSGGSFAAGSGVTEVDGPLKVTASGHFDANGGTIVLGGAGASLSCAGVAFNRVVFANATGTKTVGAGCTLPLGGDPSAAAGGSIKLNGTLAGTGTLTTSGTLTLGEGGSLSGFSGLLTTSLTIVGAYGFGSYSTFAVGKNFTLIPGAGFTAPAGTASFASNFTIKPGAAFDPNGGTVVFDGTANGKLYCANQPFHQVRFVHTAGRKVVGADCSFPLGSDPTLGEAEGSVTLNGALAGSGTLTVLQRFIADGSAHLFGFDGFVAADSFYANGVVADFGSYRRFEVATSYVQTAGTVAVPDGTAFRGPFVLEPGSTFNAPSTGTVSFAERFSVSANATFNPSGSTAVFDGTASAPLACGTTVFHLVAFSHTAGTKTVGSSCDLPLGLDPKTAVGGSILLLGSLSGAGTLATGGTLTLEEGGELSGFSSLEAVDLTVDGTVDFGSYEGFDVSGNLTIGTGGSFTAPSGIASIAGNFVNGGSFVANGGTVLLRGINQQLSGSTVFHRLTKVAGGSATLTFAAGSTATVGGKLTMLGTSYGKLLKLASSVAGKAWRIDPRGEVEVGFLSVSDSTNLGPQIVAGESFDGGGNSGWAISGPAASLLLEAQTTTPIAGTADNLTIIARDAYGNTSTSYSGIHNLTFGPVADSPSGAHATVSDSSDTPVNLGTATPIAFSSGVATVAGSKNGALTLVKAGPVSLTATDGSISGGSGLALTVSPGPAASLLLEAQTITPTVGSPANLTIIAKDAYGNTATSYAGIHNLTFGPVADSPSGAHATVSDQSGTAVNLGTATPIAFGAGTASVSGSKNGVMTLVKAGSTSITVSDGSISNGAGLAVTVSPAAATSLSLSAASNTPTAGTAANLTIIAKDAYGNTATSYAGIHNLTFGPVADSPSGAHATVSDQSGTAVNLGTATPIAFGAGTASVSGSKNGVMTLVKAGSTSITVSDGSISNGAGLAVTVAPGSPARLAWTGAKASKGTLSSPCLFTCTGTELTSSGSFKASVSVTDSYGNTVSALGSGHTISVTATSGTVTGGSLTIAGSGPAESTTQFTFAPPSKGGASTVTAATAAGTVYTSATASISR